MDMKMNGRADLHAQKGRQMEECEQKQADKLTDI